MSKYLTNLPKTMPSIRLTLTALLVVLNASQFASGQLKVLSAGNPNLQWKSAQLQLLEQQIEDPAIKGPLKQELLAQKRWLSEWKSGLLTDQPWIKQTEKPNLFTEPTLDPDKRARALRERLLGKGAKPTEKDTKELQALLAKYPKDIGAKQLHLHWLDQRQYRSEYAKAIVETATTLANMLSSGRQTENTKLARAYCYYRAARALVHQESEESVAKKPIEDPKAHESQLLGIYNQLVELMGHDRPEFILLEIRMLRRDSWFGRALMLLEESASVIDTNWYLANRQELLKELGWGQPAKEAEESLKAFATKKDVRSASLEKLID
jgi:hypothetical protein